MTIYICMDKAFPRANASANYVEYLGRAICCAGADVRIIGVAADETEAGKWRDYHALRYCNIYYKVTNPFYTLISRLYIGKAMWEKIAPTVRKSDCIICYSNNYFLLHAIYKGAAQKQIKLINCVVEWFGHEHFPYGYFNVANYWYYLLSFYKGISLSGNVIAISKKLKGHFEKENCKVMVLPPLAEPMECEYQSDKPTDKIRFIYSGQYRGKDDMGVMLRAFLQLTEEELRKTEFHITGVAEAVIKKDVALSVEEWHKLENCVIFHKWMEYKALVRLYQETHFLLLARPDNRVTQSNFPSKVPEMMCYGIIPVMTKVGDCPKLYLHDGIDSLLFAECTVDSCSSAIKRAIQLSPVERQSMQQQARHLSEQEFDYHTWSEKIMDFIEE